METESLKKYVENSNERLLKAVEDEGILGDGKTKKEIPGEKNFMEKPLHSQSMEEPRHLELAKDRIVEKRDRGNVNDCKRPSTESKQHKEQS